MAKPLCPTCGSKSVQRWGKTSSEAQRWRCRDCGGAFTPRIDNAAKRLGEFLGWLLSKSKQADMPGGGRTFRRRTGEFWRIWPLPPVTGMGVHRATLYRWLAEPDTEVKRALCDRLKKANAGFKRTMLVAIRNASEEGPENWTAAAWLLERKWPQEYARCERVVGGDVPAPVQLTLGI